MHILVFLDIYLLQVENFLKFLQFSLIYTNLRYAICCNNISFVDLVWKTVWNLFLLCLFTKFQSWPLFQMTGKYLYSKLTLYVQHVLANVHSGIFYDIKYLLTLCSYQNSSFTQINFFKWYFQSIYWSRSSYRNAKSTWKVYITSTYAN